MIQALDNRFVSYSSEEKKIGLTNFFILLVGIILSVWFLQFLWKRRKLYKAASKLPGPFALPIIGSSHLFLGQTADIFGAISKLFETYPSLFKVWFGPRLFYATCDPKINEILLSNTNVLRKEYLYRMIEPVSGGGLINQLRVPTWKRHRKIIMPTFNQKILDGFVDIFVDRSEVLVSVMKKLVGVKNVNIYDLFSRCTLDIVCKTAMGVQIDAQIKDTDFHRWADEIMDLIMKRIFNVYYHLDWIYFLTSEGKTASINASNLRNYTRNVVITKRNEYESKFNNGELVFEDDGIKRKAFLDYLIEMCYQDGKNSFTDEELIDETVTFMIAGTDTTATTNCFLFIIFGLYPDVQEKVLEEVLEVIGPDRRVQYDDLQHFKYLERVVKETMRVFPIVPMIVRALDADIDIGEHVLQKGSSVVFGILQTHRNEEYWPDPLKFDPDRFLPEEVAKRPPGCYIPFSFGPRNCIGMKYAMMTIKALVATVVRKYKVYSDYKNIEEVELRSNLVLRTKNGFKVHFELRE
ncbi:cytochrome P450 4C1-like [Sitophilus oryzae]|uniref:Cytochrome P450 4C1-like n=1 Tax=Sitophilus oryzae TaxID=7048 RepID=A0A6J2YJW9_SITOR|nr:cytochrome P450 4C1-like [Sitophilus oryzae]